MSINIVSPHFDDAVFSTFYLLKKPNINVITVFGQYLDSDHDSAIWDKICGQSSSRQMMKLRQQENKRILDYLGCQITNLKFLDHQYHREPYSQDQIMKAIIKNTHQDDLFYFPLSLGSFYNHPDHQILSQIGLKLLAKKFKISFYIDQPYMLPKIFRSNNYAKKLKTNSNCHYQTKIITLNHQQKLAKKTCMKAYQTQYWPTVFASFGRLLLVSLIGQEIYLEPLKSIISHG